MSADIPRGIVMQMGTTARAVKGSAPRTNDLDSQPGTRVADST
jgi:hypothetical protein